MGGNVPLPASLYESGTFEAECRKTRKALLAYFNDKYDMGIVEAVTAFWTPKPVLSVALRVGAYLGVIEPWLRQFTEDHGLCTTVYVRSTEGRRQSRRKLLEMPSDFKLVIRIRVALGTSQRSGVEYAG